MAELTIHLSFGTRTLRGLMAAGMLVSAATELASESVTMTTYYPAPSGVYAQMIVTGMAYLARDAGGKVGIGTTTPQAALDVAGGINLTNGSGVSKPLKVSEGTAGYYALYAP